MAEMQKLLNRLIAKHTRGVLRWQGREGKPTYRDIIQIATGDRAALSHAYWAPEYVA